MEPVEVKTKRSSINNSNSSLNSEPRTNNQTPIISITYNSTSELENKSHISNADRDRNESSENNPSLTSPASNAGGKIKNPRRNVTSLTSSLRRFISMTFNRGPSSSKSNTGPSSGASDHTLPISSSSSKEKTGRVSTTPKSSSKHSDNRSRCNSNKKPKSQIKGSYRNVKAQNASKLKNNSDISTNRESRSLSSLQASKSNEDATCGGSLTRCQTTGGSEKISRETLSDQPSSANIESKETNGRKYVECPLCVLVVSLKSAPHLDRCSHRICLDCMQVYIRNEIDNSRLNITCPVCTEPLHPNTIKKILQNEKFYLKYESFMLRRVLAAEPDARWCPAPDCSYVVLAYGCASCPKLVCGRDGCHTSFCYHCKQEWHPNQTCISAIIQRNKHNALKNVDVIEGPMEDRKSSKSSQRSNSNQTDDIKECPTCASRIIKMNDGSCNHMTCNICNTEFCWLCMKEISDLHYFSPSGCTFWGKKPWSRKKKLLWQLGMLVGAPICIILIAGIAVPAIVIGIPVWAARKLHARLEQKPFSRYKKNAILIGGVLLSFLISPIISAGALAIGIPMLMGYVYGVVPISLCRSSGGCLSANSSVEDLQQVQRNSCNSNFQTRDGISIDTAISHKLGDPSIGETSLYMSSMSLETNSIGHVTTVEREDRESASNAALAGSVVSNVIDDGNSTRALAGSIISKESMYTLIPSDRNDVFKSNLEK